MTESRASLTFVRPPNDVRHSDSGHLHSPNTRLDQVLALGSEGLTDKAIARQLGLSPGTVRTYWDRLRTLYDAATRGEVIAKAMNRSSERIERELKDIRLILERCEVILWLAGKSGLLEYVSSHTLRYSGLPPSQLIGRDFTDLMPPDEALTLQRNWIKANRSGCGLSEQVHLRRFDGKYGRFRLDIAPFEQNDEAILRWIGSAVPIL
ncbi:MAG: PAS domain-containing protein [Fimbriimonadaceae bacterium]|nr:PAS domain-containing protein [Fimbriimonadaceae bacterium]